MLDQKLIWAIFLFDFKMGGKAVETTPNINNTFSPGTANECTVQWWFKQFCKGNLRGLKMRSIIDDQWKLTTTNWEHHQSWYSYNYKRHCQRTQGQPFYGHSAFKQIGKVKKLDKWVPHERTTDQRKKNHRSEVASSVILHNNNEPFLNWFVTCNEKWILYDNQHWPAQWLNWKEAPKHFVKPNLHQKKGHGHCLVVCCPSDPL